MLDLEGVTKAYDAFRLGPIDLSVDDEILAVLGPSGCGKTTLLRTVAGLVRPDAGSIRLGGRRLDGRPPEARGTALVFQEGALFPHMTVRENVAYAATDPDRVAELAATLEVADLLDRRAGTLSGGERQRVAVARALAADPDALLFDEPLANLDAPIKRRLRDDLRTLLAPLGIPVVYVTHDQTEATGIGDRIAVIRDGRVRQLDTPEAVFERPVSRFVAGFTGNPNVFRAPVTSTGDGGAVLEWGGTRLRVETPVSDRRGPVAFCIRPEHVRILGEDENANNAVRGRIETRVFEGDRVVLRVRPIDADTTLEVTVLPTTDDRLGTAVGATVRLALPADRIHLLPGEPEPPTV